MTIVKARLWARWVLEVSGNCLPQQWQLLPAPSAVADTLRLSPEHPAEARATMDLSTLSNIDGCLKCGTAKNSGKRSCCAHGGTWFKACGNVGDAKFDHTWVDGIRACKGPSTLVSIKSPQRAVRHAGDFVYRWNTAQPLIGAHRHKNMSRVDKMPSADSTENKDCTGIAKAFSIFVFCVIFSAWRRVSSVTGALVGSANCRRWQRRWREIYF